MRVPSYILFAIYCHHAIKHIVHRGSEMVQFGNVGEFLNFL